jgi:hypothetical protein
MVNDAKLDVVKVNDLARHMTTADLQNTIFSRFTAANMAKSSLGILLLDKNEEWDRINTSFGGLPDVLQRVLMVVCAAGGIPMSRLTGSQQGRGLATAGASSGEIDLRHYYDWCKSYQTNTITPNFQLLDETIVRSSIGTFDPDVHKYDWNPLWQMDDKEKADVFKTRGEGVKVYLDTGLINEDAMREATYNMMIEDGTLPGLEDAVDEYGLEPTIPESRIWSPGIDPHTGQLIESEVQGFGGGGGGGPPDPHQDDTLALPPSQGDRKQLPAPGEPIQRRADDAFALLDFWSDEAREAALEARRQAGFHRQASAHAMARRVASSSHKDQRHYGILANLHANAAAEYDNEARAHGMGRMYRHEAKAVHHRARANARAATDYADKHGLHYVRPKALTDAAKVGKASVQYGDGDPDGDHCAVCRHFMTPDACEKVRGLIEPDAWCNLFADKTQATDAKPRTLYVYRNLLNADAVRRWFKAQGFHSLLVEDDMHVTIAHSKKSVDWTEVPPPRAGEQDSEGRLRVPPGGMRLVEKFDGSDAVVMLFASAPLSVRHDEIKHDAGATWDWPSYQPHIALTYRAPVGLDIDKVKPYVGELMFGPEQFATIDGDGFKPEHAVED